MSARAATAGLGAFLELGKPRLSALAIFAVLAGYGMGKDARSTLAAIAATAVGTLLVAMGGAALNMLIEREHDRRMARTAGRPLPTSRLKPAQVLAFGAGTAAVGLVLLALFTNWLATALCAAILVTYVGVYTPLKPVTTLNTLVGAVPGALPPVVGYAAAGGGLDQRALTLFLILFFWQIPHFLAIAWRYREDYRRAGMRMLAVTDADGSLTARQMLVYTLALIVASLLPHRLRMAGDVYLIMALFLDAFFLAAVVLASVRRSETTMRGAFAASLLYLPALFAVMLVDKL